MKRRPLNRQQRIERYAPLLLQGYGYRRLSRATGVPINTVKSDFRRDRRRRS